MARRTSTLAQIQRDLARGEQQRQRMQAAAVREQTRLVRAAEQARKAAEREYAADQRRAKQLYVESRVADVAEDRGRVAAQARVARVHHDLAEREHRLGADRLQRLRAFSQPNYVSDARDVLLDLYAADVEYSADALEDIYQGLEKVGSHVLSKQMTDEEAARMLADIGQEEDLNGRIRRNVLDTRRAVSFLMRSRIIERHQLDDAQQILRDIESLDGHTTFLFGKINFLMDATVGFININQNKIIKIFSVASVALLPPTLIASIYGMNFKAMPELDWSLGYPFAIALMIASVAAPFIYFRRKGWLR